MKNSHAILFFIIGTAMMVFLHTNELLLSAVMGIAAIAVLAADKWKNTKMFLIAMVVGGLCENLAVYLDAWSYTNASYIFTPLWLPIGWGMAVILIEEAFGKSIPVKFSKKAVLLAFTGTFLTGIFAPEEIGVLGLFAVATVLLFLLKKYKKQEFMIGVMAAIFGTLMETACILAGAWHYNYAMFGTPIWLPLCWFNAFLIMRRIIIY